MKGALAGIGLAAGGLLAMAGPAAAGNGDVVVVGDSLVTLSTDELEPKLRGLGWIPHIQGVNGSGLTAGTVVATGTDWHLALAQAEQDHDPRVVVIVLGTNDAEPVNAGHPYKPLVDSLAATTDAPRVLWANCSTHTAVPERNAGCTIINGDLNAKATERTGFEVLPYDEEVVTDPSWDSTDTVHPGPYAQNDFAQLIADRVGPK
jgi:lysophospholipase L1-like esterase